MFTGWVADGNQPARSQPSTTAETVLASPGVHLKSIVRPDRKPFPGQSFQASACLGRRHDGSYHLSLSHPALNAQLPSLGAQLI